jgi:hypothetical protein
MNDLSDIDPEIIEAVSSHADAFIDADNSIDEIIAWGETELKAREAKILESVGTLDDFKAAAREVEHMVKDKLAAFEEDLKKQYPPAEDSAVE